MGRCYDIDKIPTHSPEWYKYRMKGIGSSEIGYILYPDDQYSNLAKLFHQKVGIMDIPDFDNEPMFNGRHLEAYIANLWKYYWNGEYIGNYEAKNQIRKCHSVEGYMTNPDYPFFFSSPDRLINKGMPSLLKDDEGNPIILTKGGNLEIKNVNEYFRKDWTDKAERKYIAQVHQQMLVMGLDYSEIAAFFGGNSLKVYVIERNQEMIDKIIYNGYQFWEMYVKPAKILAEDWWHHTNRGETEKAERVAAEIDRYEPMPQGNKSYREWSNENRKVEREYAPAPEGAKSLAEKHDIWREVKKKVEAKLLYYSNSMIDMLNKEKAEKFNFGDGNGYVSSKANKKGDYSFTNKVAADINIDELFNEMEAQVNEGS